MTRLHKISNLLFVLSVVISLSLLSAGFAAAQGELPPNFETLDDRDELAQYQATLPHFAPQLSASPVTIVISQHRFEQIPDRAALAEYQATMMEPWPRADLMLERVAVLPSDKFEQLVAPQAQREYTAQVYNTALPEGSPPVCFVLLGESYQQIDDRAQLAEYQAHMLDYAVPVKSSMVRLVLASAADFDRMVIETKVAVHQAEFMNGPLSEEGAGQRIAVIAPGILN